MSLLALENLCFSIPSGNGSSPQLINNLSCEFEHGDLAALFGPSGGGKSTLLRLLVRLERPTAGRILLSGEDISSLHPQLVRRRIGLLAQRPFMFAGSVLDNLLLPFRWSKKAAPTAESPELLELLEFCKVEPARLKQDAGRLSVGQQQRVALARTLLQEPELLLLDEPTSALDRPTADHLGETLRYLNRERNITMLMVSHDLRLIERVCRRGLFMVQGRVVETGEVGEMLQQPRSLELQTFLAGPDEEP